MKSVKIYTIIGILFVLVTGSLAHYLYTWSGHNYLMGLFAPVNESIWEHMKLLFFPMLLYSLIMICRCKNLCPCICSSLYFGIILGTLFIPTAFYAYTTVLGKSIFLLDIGIFILSVILAFWSSYRLTLSCKLDAYTSILRIVICLLFVCFLVFTTHPPASPLFQDPAVSDACGAAVRTLHQYPAPSLF